MNQSTLVRRAALALSCLVFTFSPAHANDYAVGGVKIDHPWARPTLPGQKHGGGFATLVNRGSTADRLVGASSSAAERVEVHEMRMDGDVMRMREIGGLDLPQGQTVKLAPGGLHLMLMNLKAPLKAGDQVPLTLRFEKAGSVDVTLAVEMAPAAAATPATPAASAGGGMQHHHGHKH